jgi:hypothetical protein
MESDNTDSIVKLVQMGVIYKLTFENGKSYIGQTIKGVEKRIKGHIHAAKSGKGGCWALCAALIEFDYKFTHEILITTTRDKLNHYEAEFIKSHDTVYPNGYNILIGTKVPETEELRRAKEWPFPDFEWVKHVIHYHETNKHGTKLEGFRIVDHPNGRDRTFADSSLTMRERYELAVECKLEYDSRTEYYDERIRTPKHVSRYKEIGFAVRKPGHPSKYFNGTSQYRNLVYAVDHLISICKKEELPIVLKGFYTGL